MIYIVFLFVLVILAVAWILVSLRALVKRIRMGATIRKLCKEQGYTVKRLRLGLWSMLWHSARPDLAIETPEKTYLIRFWFCINPVTYYQFINEHYAVRTNAFQFTFRNLPQHGPWGTFYEPPSDYLEGSWNPKAIYLPPMKRPVEYESGNVQEMLVFSPAPANVWVRKGTRGSLEYLSDGDRMGGTRICYGIYLRNLLKYGEAVDKTAEEKHVEKLSALRYKLQQQTDDNGSYVPPVSKEEPRPPEPARFDVRTRLKRRFYTRLYKYLAWVALGALLMFGGGMKSYERFDISLPLLLVIFGIYAGALFFGMGFPAKLSDRSFEGRIESLEILRILSTKPFDRRGTAYMQAKVKLEESNGDVWIYEKQANDPWEDLRPIYREKYLLRHVRWAPYDQSFKDENDPEVRCVWCGVNNRSIDEGCSACGASLIPILPIKKT